MTREISVRSSLQINKSDIALDYHSRPTQQTMNLDATDPTGPTPGGFLASTAGTDVDLSGLTTPGWCFIQNRDDTNKVQIGIWDPEGSRFYPFADLLAGEFFVLRLSSDIEEEFGTGVGTLGPSTNRLRVKAISAACQVSVEAWDK